ncbi:MAG: hypothetical protein JXR76_04435 [Deltaproteobacteria bacterium]|nr:hypothetical protein [Deltaproteobacteria bacterium]
MSSIDLHNDEIGIKIVYYGPGLGGKTSSLQHMHTVLKPEHRGRMISLATGIDRTLYFDFLPIQLPKIKNFSIRMSVYTVPGQVHYDATRKLVLQGADGVVFVADSQPARQDANIESMENLQENLKNHGMDPSTVPMVIQYNKRDLANIMPLDQMDRELNFRAVPYFETSATKGFGVFEALKAITKLVLADLKRKGIYRDDTMSIVPSPPGDDTAPQPAVAVRNTRVPGFAPDGEGQDFAALKSQPPAPSAGRAESSGSLEAALAQHAHLRKSTPPPPTSAEERMRFSNLWTSGYQKAQEIELNIQKGKYRDAVVLVEKLMKTHLSESGVKYSSLEEALLVLGISSGHYVRYSGIVAKSQSGNTSMTDALFCLFFLTDVELRMQSAGLKH